MSNIKVDRGLLDETLATMYGSLKYNNTYLFYAHIVGQCSIKIDLSLPAPAGISYDVDHYNLYINPNYFDKYTLEGRLAILKHEMLHIINMHVQRRLDKDGYQWNLATDCAINQLIDINHLPEDGIMPHNIGIDNCPINESAELYYELLKQNDNKCQCKSFDDHSTWNLTNGDQDLQTSITKNMIEKSINETIKSKCTIPEQISMWIDLLSKKAELDWKKVLRGIIGNKKVNKRTTIMRRDRRFPGRDDLKGKTKDRLFNLLVISDVSGSISDKALINLWGEIRHICDITKTDIDLIQVDCEPSNPEKINKHTKIIERKGSGGTFLSKALNIAKDEKLTFDAIVVTTDGLLNLKDVKNFAKTGKKIIWLIEKTGTILEEMEKGKMKAFKLKE